MMAECQEKKTGKQSTQSDQGTLFCFSTENTIYRTWDCKKMEQGQIKKYQNNWAQVNFT